MSIEFQERVRKAEERIALLEDICRLLQKNLSVAPATNREYDPAFSQKTLTLPEKRKSA